MEYYLTAKGNEIESIVVRWMNLESVIQSEEVSKRETVSYINVYMWNLEK